MLILGGCIGRGALVALAAFRIPSWYNEESSDDRVPVVLAAFQIPSWYNSGFHVGETRYASWQPSKSPVGLIEMGSVVGQMQVLAAFQIPSWYN